MSVSKAGVCAIRSKAVFNTWSEHYQQEILLTESVTIWPSKHIIMKGLYGDQEDKKWQNICWVMELLAQSKNKSSQSNYISQGKQKGKPWGNNLHQITEQNKIVCHQTECHRKQHNFITPLMWKQSLISRKHLINGTEGHSPTQEPHCPVHEHGGNPEELGQTETHTY